jgi:hypothetical protein
MPPPPVRLRLRLSSHRRLSLRPSLTSCPDDCRVDSRHAAALRHLSRRLGCCLGRHFNRRIGRRLSHYLGSATGSGVIARIERKLE